jgi:hypothetical protein
MRFVFETDAFDRGGKPKRGIENPVFQEGLKLVRV